MIKENMEIKAKVLNFWPKLAWYATWEKGGDTMEVYCGNGVEVRKDRLFEGAWDGDFQEGAFDRSSAFFGSGLVLGEDEVVLVPTTGNQERIFVTADGNSTVQCASNSLLCWLTQTGEQLDPDWPDYYIELCKVNALCPIDADNLLQTLPTLRLDKGRELGIVNVASWVIGTEKSWRCSARKGQGFSPDFSEYRSFLSEGMSRILANASSPLRKTSLQAQTSLSEGFDAVAVSVLAAELGVKKCITLLGREDARFIGRKLGLQMTSKHRALSWFHKKSKVQEFHALPIGQNQPMGLFESTLSDSLLFTGIYGDSCWIMSPDFWYNCLSSNSLLEFRLRIGLIIIPVPAIGIWHSATINEISKSTEMHKFREEMGGTASEPWYYISRPIPRRIGLEAGLNWEDFGNKKIAGAIAPPDSFQGLSKFSFEKYLRGVEEVEKSAYSESDYPYFYGNRYRWGIHWAHKGLKNRYRLS
jgi:hypothetical protein